MPLIATHCPTSLDSSAILTFRVCTPVTADGFMTPVGVDVSGLGAIAAFSLPIATDFHVLGAAAVLFTRLIRLLWRPVRLDGNRLGASRRSSDGESECGNRQHCHQCTSSHGPSPPVVQVPTDCAGLCFGITDCFAADRQL
jgi:hypothetical protein